jgi:opacity protein-like surface antigen
MQRFARFLTVCSFVTAGLVGTAHAQSAVTDNPFAVQGTVGATFGHVFDVSFGVELDYRAGTEWEFFLEAGRMRNVASSRLDAATRTIVDNLAGAEASVGQVSNFIDIGVKYLLVPVGGGYQPYVGVGFGGAQIRKDVTFSVGGTEVTEEQLLTRYGEQLGNDLAGRSNRPMFVALAGISRDFAGKGFLDVSYRYGAIFANKDFIEGDTITNTSRVQIGVGIRF